MSSIKYTTQNEGQVKVITIIWTIKRFVSTILSLNESRQEIHAKVNFQNELEGNNSKFRFLLQYYNIRKINIFYLSSNSVFLKVIFTILCRDSEEKSIAIKEYHQVSANTWQFLASLHKRDIIEDKSMFLVTHRSLRLKFQFHVANEVKIDSINVEGQLSNDLAKILNNGYFSDIIIKSLEGIEYNVHKNILASRSVVLKAHFEHNSKECLTNVVESPFKSDLLKEVLTYIYSDEAPQIDKIPERLLVAADYYQLIRLKTLCEEALHKKLTVDNAIETLQLADLYSANTLRQLTLEFIKKGQAKLITETEGWRKLKSVALIKTVYESVLEDYEDTDSK